MSTTESDPIARREAAVRAAAGLDQPGVTAQSVPLVRAVVEMEFPDHATYADVFALIAAGRVCVNCEVVTNPDRIVTFGDETLSIIGSDMVQPGEAEGEVKS